MALGSKQHRNDDWPNKLHYILESKAPLSPAKPLQYLIVLKEIGADCRRWVKPTGYIDAELIEQNWDDILRLIATIMLKETTASEIFRRLNSYSQQHSLYRALKAFGKIIKSTFILRYIDEVELRKAIERQLNKIEHAHRFTRAVSVGNPREFIQAEKQKQVILSAGRLSCRLSPTAR